jgi:dTDP-4-amino-4,6-dideoxygalactose transaminase
MTDLINPSEYPTTESTEEFPPWPLACDTWDHKELDAMKEVMASGMFTCGEKVARFEEVFCSTFGYKYAVMVNSGSSANLLMVAAAFEMGWLKRGDKVIVPAVGWSTSYFPFMQYGLELVFVDVEADTWNIDPSLVDMAITPDVKAVLGINLLGNPCTFGRLQSICDEHKLLLLEDNCESMGSAYDSVYCGGIGKMGTFSTFFSHHIQTMEGGIIVTADEELYHTLKSLRSHGWTRDTKWFSGEPFEFLTMGYNVRPGELNGAIGIVQLDKFDYFESMRNKNASVFIEHFGDHKDWNIQQVSDKGAHSWFGFGLVFKSEELRDKARAMLVENNVGVRPIVTGNFTNQPVMARMSWEGGPFPIADTLDRQGLFMGNNPQDLTEIIELTAANFKARL